MKVSVVGLGYLGITHAVTLASLGHEVVGYDLNHERVQSLRLGQVPFHEPGLGDLFSQVRAAKLISFESEIGDWCKNIDVHFICVGTPLDEKGDSLVISEVLSSIVELVPFLDEDSLIVGRSTVPVGTHIEVEDLLSSRQSQVRLAWNPEFLSEGTALNDSLFPQRIVIGVSDPKSENQLRQMYNRMLGSGVPFLVMDIASAELTKIASNAFLALKVSYINGLASIAEKAGASTKVIAHAMGLDPRIGSEFLRNGIGFGGSCLPKDLRQSIATANLYGSPLFASLLVSVAGINQERLDTATSLVEHLAKISGDTGITVLGASFKSNTDDLRGSPGIALALNLQERGIKLTIHDPVSAKKVKQEYPDLDATEDLSRAVQDAEVLVFTTNWAEYTDIDPLKLRDLSKRQTVVDAVQVIDEELWREAGWSVIVLGESNHIFAKTGVVNP